MKYNKPNISSKKIEYIIESIITPKIVGKKQYYLIKWKGYSLSDCTWEQKSNLSNVIDMVEDFDKNYPFSINHKALKQFNILYEEYKNKKKKLKKKAKSPQNNNIIIIEIDINDFKANEEGQKKKEIEKKNETDTLRKSNKSINEIKEKISSDCSSCIIDKKNEEKTKLIEPVLIW